MIIGIVYIAIHSDKVDTVALVNAIYEDAEQTKQQKTR